MFVAGVDVSEANELAQFMGFTLGSLPVHYLGLPLLTGRLKASDCIPPDSDDYSESEELVGEVAFLCWSFAVYSVGFTKFSSFWFNVFVLPASVTQEVDRFFELSYGEVVGREGWYVDYLEGRYGSRWMAWLEEYILRGGLFDLLDWVLGCRGVCVRSFGVGILYFLESELSE